MATLSLKISLMDGKVTKTMQFDPLMSTFDACKIIRDKITEANQGEAKDYGIFISSTEDNKIGVWLEPGKNLEFYMLRNGDIVEYKKKMRTLRVRMLDGTLKTMMVDDSQNVANLMVVICTKIGITNYDEYSLVRDDIKEEIENPDKPNYGTLTLKRKQAEKERDVKMDQLRKKLRTDDEVNWIDPSKTLRGQGVDESETVLLRRKYFFSDQNIDSRDPVQLNLLYVQARDAILDGTHPVTLEKACEFAGIQCQIQFGDHKEDKHTTGFLDLREFLPASYMKVKSVEKKVFKAHKNYLGQSELDAKVTYTKTARALSTYGVAFFLVKEKLKGKNKLVPRLLGVTKDSVLRLDERTKEILQTWPLTTVRRWCASPNTFTLDFGDYSDQYYSVQTTEAEQILQLIAGYIDIILKKQKVKDHFGIEGDEGSTMVEDSVSPLKATILQHESSTFGKVNTESLAKPAIMRAGAEAGQKPYAQGHMGGAQFTTISGKVNMGHAAPTVQQQKVSTVMSEPQRALLSTISSGQEVIRITERELVRAQLPELGSDAASIKWKEVTMDTNKQNVSSQIAAMNAATAQVVTLTSGPTDEVDHTAVGAAITTIASNLPEVTKGVSMIAALMEDNDNGDKLLDATRRLCTAFSDLLKAAEPETKEPRQNLLNAASRVGEASTQVLYTIGEESEESREIQDMLLALAKAVANTTAALVLKAKNVAATCKDDQQAQNKVIGAATQCALATSQLVACAKVVAPTLQSPACRDQLSGAARQVALAVRKLVSECESTAPQGPGLTDVTGAAADVVRALDQLMHHVNTDRRQQARETIHETHVENIMTTTDRLFSSQGDPAEMVRQARLLGQATAQLIQNIKVEAERQPDSETQRRLMAAAKLLADATAKMVEAARQCASSPHDKVKQEALCRAAEELKYVTVDYASSSPDVKKHLFTRLETVAKQAASTGTQFISSVQNAGAHITNRQSQETLVQESRTMAEHIPRLIEGVKGTMNHPDDSNSQLDLINASEAFLQPGAHAAQAARAVLPTIQDQASALQLNNTTQQLATTCSELRSAVSRARASCSGLELDAAAQIIRSLQRELAEVDQAARDCRLRPLPGETAESASRELGSSNREAAYAVSRLVSAAQQGSTEYAGKAARDTAQALRSAAGASRALAATQPNSATMVITSTQEVMSHSLILVEEVKRCLASHETADHTRLASIAKNVTVALDNSVNSMPSHQDVDQTIESINETLQVLSMGEFPPTNKSYNQLQQDLNVAAEGLSTVAGETAQAASSPAQLGNTSKQFGTAFNQLLGVSMEMAGQTTDYEVQNQMVMSMKNVTVVSAKLLTTARYVSNDPTQPNSKNQLSAAARSVTDSINYLVDVCTSAAPGQKECDSAVRNIQSVNQLLQHPSEPVNELGYYQCVDTIIEHSRILGKDGMSGMANHVQKGEHVLLGKSVKSIADSICGLIECTAQSAYLVAVSDPSSVAGRPGLVDQAQFARASQVIQQACNNMVNPTSNEEQVLSAATLIAKHTSALCNACRVASSKTTNPVAKRHFVQSAKDVANSTAHLVKEIKALDSDYSQASRMRCGQATVPLLDAVNSLCQFANSPEFVSVPAKISQQARRAQDPILDSGRKIIQGSCSMIESAKCLAVEPNNTSQWRNLDKHSKTVTESIKSLVNNIRDKAPGQSECLAALDILSSQIRELDQVSLQAVSQNLPAKKGNSLQGYTEQMESSATEMLDKLEQLRAAAKFEAENLGHSVNQMVSYIEPLTSASVGVASNMVDTQQQMRVLDQTKTVLEGCTQLVLASKEAGGNPGATSIHPDVDEYSQSVRDAAADLLANAESLAAQRGIVSGLLDSISRSVTRITDHRMSLIGSFNEADSFVDYQTRMVGAAKEIARLATEMTAKSGTDVSKLATLAGDLTHRFNQLAQDSVGAAATTTNNDVAQRIRSTVVELGNSVITLVKSGGLCQVSKDSTAQRQVADGSKQVSEKVGSVLSALQAGSKGTQACIDAAATVAAIIGDLDTTILFASAGTLHADDENDAFADHRESILKTAKVLVEDTKTLVGGAASSQEQLASAAQNSVSTIVLLSSVVKQGAMSLGSGNPDSQVMLIHSVRDVAAALRDLIQATKDASGKHIGDPAMARLKDSAKVGRCDDLRRWSLPNNDRYGANDSPGIRSLSLGPESRHRNVKTSLSNCDSETDWFISDQEEELIKILQEDSSQDELENNNYGKLGNFTKNKDNSVVSLNSSHTQWSYKIAPEESADEENAVNQEGYSSRTLWKDNMEFRILGYAEMIVLNEIRALEEVVARLDEQEISKTPVNPRDNFDTLKKLDSEMQNIVMTLNEIDNEIDFIDDDDVPTVRNVVDLKVDRRKRVSLSPMRKEQHSVHVENYYDIIRTQEEFWQMFSVEAEIWKALMIKNHEREMETKHKLDQFSGELKIGEFISPEKKPRFSEPEPLGSIVEVRKIVLDGAFNDVIHDLEDISKRNFNFKGFDPQIEELLKIGALRLKHRKMQDTSVAEAFDNIYADASDIENADLTFDQLCKMEEHYEEIERLYREYYEEEISSGRLSSRSNNNRQATSGSLKRVKLEKLNKPSQKVFKDNVKQIVDVERATQTEDSFKDTSFDDRLTLEVLKNLTSRFEDKKDIVTNVENNTNIIRNIVTNSENIVNNHTTTNRFIENQYGEPIKYDTSLNYPMQFYANNWWSIYGDIVNNRAKQFGSLDRWWSHYENAAQSHQQDQTITKSSRGYSVPQSSRIHSSGDTRRGEISRVHSQRETTTNHRENIMRRHMQDASMKRVANIQQSESREAREQNEARTRGWVQHRIGSDQPVMVTNVTSLLKTVKAVEDEHTRGTRALESTIEAIAQEINVLLSPGAPKLTATPEELVRCTKAITVATAKAVAAGNSAKQDDVIAAANIGRRAIGDMLAICKGAAFKCAETQELKARTLKAGNDAASSYRELLVAVLKAVQGQTAARQSFPDLGRAVAQAAAEIVAAAEALKGSDWVDPDDPTVIAENELLGAAASIDAAANKLAALRPRKSIKEADETLNFDEMILDAAKSIIAATSALVRAASAAQRELIDQGKVARRPLYSSDDGQWSEGLISAARLAAAAAHSLAESANALVQGLGSEERLVSSAKQVAGSTAQLLVACKVKADPNSESTRRLQAAGNAVIKSTDNLVRAAQRAISHEEERCLVLNRRMVGGIAQEINARSEVLRIERQLDEARGRLTAIRQAKYKLKGGDTSGDETDNEITLHSGGQPLKQDGGYTSDSPTHGGRNSSNFGQNTTSFGQNMSSFGQNTTTSFGQNRSSFGANNTSGLTDTSFDSNYAQNNTSIGQNTTSFGQNNTSFGQNNTSFGQNNTSFGQNNTSFGQNNSNFGQNTSFTKTSNFSSSTMMDKGLQVKQASPPPPNPPPPMTTNLSTFSRSINTNIANSGQNDDYSKTTSTTIPAQNYEAFTTRSPNPPNKNYETRSFEVPRPLNIITTPEYYSNKMEEEHKTFTESNTSAFSSYSKDQTPRIMSGLEKPKPAGSPLSPKFNAKFDLKREFESSDLSRNNYSQNVLSSNVQDSRTENTFNSLKRNEYQQMFAPKSPVSPKPFSSDSLPYTVQSPYSTLGSKTYAPRYDVKSPKSPSFNTQPGYSETNQSYSFRSETANKGSNIPVANELARITSVQSPKHENVQMFGKEVYTYGGPNYSQETMTEVKDIPNGTQKVTTTKIYSSTPMKITSTNTKYESSAPTRPNFDSLNEFTREFGNNDSNYNTLNSDYGSRATDTMKSFTSQSSSNMDEARRNFMRPSDYKQSDFQSSTTVSKSLKTPAELNKELDSMERKLLKQTISSEVIEKKTVMTTSSKSESSSTTTKKFGNF